MAVLIFVGCGKLRTLCAKARVETQLLKVFDRFYLKSFPAWSLHFKPNERVNRQGGMMKRVKNIAITIAGIFLFGVVFFSVAPAQGEVQPSDPAAYYKAKCVACHGQKAEKKFDATLTDEQLLDVILKGKKPEKPPNMPAYGEKGVTSDQAKALLEHMKQLRSAQ
jgi:mono/diheme cytochrome c family protein